MRLGILTLHAGFNEGAILQSLALQRTISDLRPGFEVEIIDHRHPRLMDKAYGPADNARKRALQRFCDHVLPISPQRFLTNDRQPTFNFAQKRYRAIVVGSDEVWKVTFQRRLKGLLRLQTDPFAPAFPNVFWPDCSISIPKLSYAATVGEKTDWFSIPDRLHKEMADILSGFSFIGVRDERTRAFVEWVDSNLTKKVSWTPDPTLTTDLTKSVDRDKLHSRLTELGVDFQRPRLLVILSPHNAYGPAVEAFRRRGFQIISASDKNPYADIDLTKADIGPLEWASLAASFDICLSERMHGCIFSILNRCPLICVDRRLPTCGFPTKNNVLMQKLGLAHRYVSVSGPDGPAKLLKMCSDLDERPIDWNIVDEHLANLRQVGRSFLDSSLPRSGR
ncbi:MAG: polysaccharide pyruvyl transferase family protein [Alphaproteobacteria bacterium]|nr:polysaccharide pyruvyl transferase family protein [Alphaproteobacteria bacterium]